MGNELVRKKHLHGDLKEHGKNRTSHSNAHNEKGKPFKWIKTAEPILDRMRRFGLRTQQVHARGPAFC